MEYLSINYRTVRYFILMVIPVGMIASVPTRALVDPTDIFALPSLLIMAALFCFLSNRFWHWSVKRYMTIG
jgi:ABC-2 type transport system permease protein